MNFKFNVKKIQSNVFGEDEVESKSKKGLSKPIDSLSKVTENKEDSDDIAKVMGFAGFGKFSKSESKASETKSDVKNEENNKVFDLDKLVEENRKNARKLFGEVEEDKLEVEDEKEDEQKIKETKVKSKKEGDNVENDEANEEEEEDDEDDDDDNEDDEADRYSKLPIANKFDLVHGTKTVSALAIDSDGNRLFSGGVDFSVKIWDFTKMLPDKREELRSFEPCGCHPISRLSFSCSGQHVLIVSGSSQAKVVDRDGQNVAECPRGDPYLRDMNRTKGHVAMVNDGCWSTRDPSQFITCAGDGTVRIWNVESAAGGQNTVLKVRSKAGLRAIPNSLALATDLSLLVVGSDDGSICGWDHRRQRYVNTCLSIRNAHTVGNEITSVSFSHSGFQLASRSLDGTLALWDVRTQKMIRKYSNLANRYSGTDCLFSPDDQLLLTGVSAEKEAPDGRLVAFDLKTGSDEPVETLTLANTSVVRMAWHPRINQIVVGTSDGKVQIHYDSTRSSAGALSVLRAKARKTGPSYKSDQAFVCAEPTVLTPHSLPIFKANKKRPKVIQEMKDRLDPIKSKRPELPIGSHGQGGRIASAGSTYAQFIAKNLALKDIHPDDAMNPRDALLRHAADAEKNPYWVAPAYQKTQPKAVFQKTETDADDQPPPKKIAK